MDNYLIAYINKLKGNSGTGGLLGEAQNVRNDPIAVLEPGDLVTTDINGELAQSMSSPIAYDLWYLRHTLNMLSRWTEKPDFIPTGYLADGLSFLENQLLGVKPLAFARDLESFVRNEYDYWVATGSMPRWQVFTEWFIHIMPFEFWTPLATVVHDSAGPSASQGFIRGDYVGYMMFPIAQLGVMEVISIMGQVETEASSFKVTTELTPIVQTTSDYFFPPGDIYTGKNFCLGDHLIESGYSVLQGKRKQIEWLPASHLSNPDIDPQSWLKYWVHKDDKFPTPGEFIFTLVKPMAVPPHIWWNQKSSVYVHAGNWFETDQLTSGIVVTVTDNVARVTPGIGAEYKVKVHGIDIIAYASDFAEYRVDDRVALLKILAVKDTLDQTSFAWTDVYSMEELDKDRRTYDYLIVPFEFYK